MSNKSPLIACISLCLIDDKFHKDEKRYLEDICEEEWELSVDEVQNVHDEIKDKGINQFKNFFYEFTEKVPDNEKEYYFELFTDLAEVDGYLHSKEILLLDQLQKIWNIKKEASSIFVPSKEQKEIIEENFSKRIVVISPPGCGKTAIAALRCNNLITEQNVNPSNLLVLSFSNAAIKELKDRIEKRSNINVDSIKLSTIDSQTFKFLRGWGEQEVREYMTGDYEQNIRTFIDLIKKKNEDVISDIKSFEHIIIDEAQDITGIRSELLLIIIKNINKNCGITIFGDPNQAIYNFTLDDGDQSEEQENFLDELIENKKFAQKTLNKIFRTDSKKLLDLFTKFRKNFVDLKQDSDGQKDFLKKKKILFEKAEEDSNGIVGDIIESVGKGQKHLFLFRKKVEMLNAANTALKNKQNISLRYGASPNCLYPWIARIFYDHMDETISKKYFIDKWQNIKVVSTMDPEEAWNKIHREAPIDKDVNVETLREKLSSGKPSFDLCMRDYGESSNVLGTVHASKGRESEKVSYYTFKNEAPQKNSDFREETRIMYVAITRCRNDFSVRDLEEEIGYREWNKKIYDRIYVYRKGSWTQPYFHLQVGLNGDLDEIRLVASPSSNEWGFTTKSDVDENQKFFSKIFNPIKVGVMHQVGHGKNYSMVFGKQKIVDPKYNKFVLNHTYGYMGKNFEISVNSIIKKHVSGSTFKHIDDIYMIGSKTCVISKNNSRLPSVYEPYGKTGFFLAPILAGWAHVPTKVKSSRRYRKSY